MKRIFHNHKMVYSYAYPSNAELLEIFPEARAIVPQKIEEWTRQKGKLLAKETIPYLKKVNVTCNSDFARWFWLKIYTVFATRMEEILSNLKRLKRLQRLLERPDLARREADFGELKASAKERPIVELYEFDKLRHVGKTHVACCPFHDDRNPSFYIFPDNRFKCFGCGAYGDSIDFLQKLRNASFREVVLSV